jgi:hypothetical protein
MTDKDTRSESPDGAAGRAQGGRPDAGRRSRRSAGLAVLVATAAIGLAVFDGSGSAHVAGSGKSSGQRGENSATTGSSSAAAAALSHATKLVDQWASCERSHGDPNQSDPAIDAHRVINITTPLGAMPAGDPHGVTGTCSEYLAAARRALAGGQPIDGWGNQAEYDKYANCMRANGFPTYPYPSGTESDGHSKTNFNGTGIDPTSPAFLNGNANQTCGKQIGAPAWWINGWGPPGDVSVATAGVADGLLLHGSAKNARVPYGLPVPAVACASLAGAGPVRMAPPHRAWSLPH